MELMSIHSKRNTDQTDIFFSREEQLASMTITVERDVCRCRCSISDAKNPKPKALPPAEHRCPQSHLTLEERTYKKLQLIFHLKALYKIYVDKTFIVCDYGNFYTISGKPG